MDLRLWREVGRVCHVRRETIPGILMGGGVWWMEAAG